MAKRLEDLRRRDRPLKYVTLGQATRVGEPVFDGRKRLSGTIRKMRRTKEWRAHVKGGEGEFEETWSGGAWNCHIHLLMDCTYWPKQQLSDLVRRVTNGESYIVDIQTARKGVELEAVKYSVKLADLPPAQVVEYFETMPRVRSCVTFGDWYRKREDVEKETELDLVEDAGPDGELTDHLRLVEEEFDGDESATEVLDAVVSYVREHAGEVVARRLLLEFDVARVEVETRCRSA